MTTERTGVGVACGIAVLCALAAAVTAVREPGPLLPSFGNHARATRECAGARLTFTVRGHDPVRGTLEIVDPRSRTWQLAWSAHDGPTSIRATPGGATARAVFTDLDAGTSVRARPGGARSGCSLSTDRLPD